MRVHRPPFFPGNLNPTFKQTPQAAAPRSKRQTKTRAYPLKKTIFSKQLFVCFRPDNAQGRT